jgi:hypothetical protein
VYSSFLSDRAEARAAGPKGHGVFATGAIAAGTTVAAFGGAVCDCAELDTLSEAQRTHSIQIDDDLFMVGPDEFEPADYFNHSCAPNAGIVGNVVLVAMRDIGAGEEICFDYAMCDTDDYDEFPCACGAAECRGIVTSGDWKLDALRERYRGWRSSYIQRRLDENRLD